MGADGLGNLVADTHDRIERGHGFLEDHGDVGAAQAAHVVVGKLQQVARSRAPEKRTSPVARAAGGSSRMRARAVRDLPEPDSPTRPRTSRGARVKLRSRTAVRDGWRFGDRGSPSSIVGNETVRLRTSSRGSTGVWYQRINLNHRGHRGTQRNANLKTQRTQGAEFAEKGKSAPKHPTARGARIAKGSAKGEWGVVNKATESYSE